MATKIDDLLAKRDELDLAIAQAMDAGRAEAVAEVKRLIKTYRITAREVKSVLVARKPRSVAVKRTAVKKTARKNVRK